MGLTLPLLVLLDNADNAHDTVALDYLTLIADFFYGRPYFHAKLLVLSGG